MRTRLICEPCYIDSADVELVQAAFDAFFRGDERAWLELAAPDIVITQFPDQLDMRDYHGREGLMQVMRDWLDTWDDWSLEVSTVRDIGGHVLMTALQRGRGKGSGVPVEDEVAFVFTVRQGEVARWRMFRSEPEALDAVKVTE